MRYQFTIDADHFQFYLEDDTIERDTSLLWSDQAHKDRLDVLPGLIAVATERFGGKVAVAIEVVPSEPIDPGFAAWDHVVECCLEVEAERVLLTSAESDISNAPEVPLPPGTYRARVYYGNLDSVSDELDLQGDDHYRIVLWPGAPMEPRVLKRKPPP
ncbi:MAG TPA: hypothetical protein VGD69_16235 [Herpetosiphonaceae bacterium]